MRQIITLGLLLLTLTGLGQNLTSDEWDEQAKTNIRLLPKYGLMPKSAEQMQADQEFIDETMKQVEFKGDRSVASDHMIDLGFRYLYRQDLKTAMYRFNQAYLLDSLNTDIFWGYGAVYMTLGNYQEAKAQYDEGLSKDPNNTHLLTDLGTYYMAQYYAFEPIDSKVAMANLDSAITYMQRSYELDKTDQNTLFKLSILYWNKEDCENAWKFYNECKAFGGQPITEAYTNDLKKRCKGKN
jgi:tetratricopeptide (TPR) repeat protein